MLIVIGSQTAFNSETYKGTRVCLVQVSMLILKNVNIIGQNS